MHRSDEILPGKSRVPGPVAGPAVADLGDDVQVVRVGMQRLADQVVDGVRAVEAGRVDVRQAQLHDGTQHADRGAAVAGRPPHPGPASCIAPKPIRVRVRSPASGKLPPRDVTAHSESFRWIIASQSTAMPSRP